LACPMNVREVKNLEMNHHRVVVTTGSIWGVEPLVAGLVNVSQKIFFSRRSSSDGCRC